MTAAGNSEAQEIAAYEKNASWGPSSLGYLASSVWWNSWVQYSGYTGPGAATTTLLQLPGGSSPRPGPISNADLLPSDHAAITSSLYTCESAQATPLRPNLVEQQDFVVLSPESWQRLQSLYSGGPAIARRAVAEAGPNPSAGRPGERWVRLALYPLQLEVVYQGKGEMDPQRTVLFIEPEASLATLKTRACAALGVHETDVALWDFSGGHPVRSLEALQPGEQPDSAEPTESGCAAAAGAASYSAAATPAPGAAPGDSAAGDLAGQGSTGAAVGTTTMDVDAGAAGSGTVSGGDEGADGYLRRALRVVPVLDKQVLLLRRKDAPDSDTDDDDACGSDNDTGVPASRRPAAARKTAAGAAAAAGAAGRAAASEAAGVAALRRASAAGASGSRSDGGSAVAATTTPSPPARTSGGGGSSSGVQTLPAGTRAGQRAPGAWDDNVSLRDGQTPGLAGLSNLGNTCFMNSSLQCLAHAVPLMTAFLGGYYLQDLNRTNPLGMKGELAEAFGSLMAQLWRGGVSAVTPRAFKAKIGRFAPQFSGYAQHDSQEFLAFLLDGLHEDTNRIKNKPYIEEKDPHGRHDEEVAAEAWANYRARNNSLVVDHFQGLFKSTVDCPQCGFNSVKFDPFMYLSLPLPESRRRVVEVVLVRTDGLELPTRMALELPSGALVADMLRAAAKAAGLPAEAQTAPESHLLAARPLRASPTAPSDELVLLTDTRSRLADALEAGGSASSYSLRSSAASDQGLVVYYYPDPAQGPTGEAVAPVIVHFRRPDSRRLAWNRGVWCGAPLVLYMPADQPPYDPSQVAKITASHRTEYELTGDCPLSAALARVLRPIQRHPLPDSDRSLSMQPPQPQSQQPGAEPAATGADGLELLQAEVSAAAEEASGEVAGTSAAAATIATAAAPAATSLGGGTEADPSAAAPMEEDEAPAATHTVAHTAAPPPAPPTAAAVAESSTQHDSAPTDGTSVGVSNGGSAAGLGGVGGVGGLRGGGARSHPLTDTGDLGDGDGGELRPGTPCQEDEAGERAAGGPAGARSSSGELMEGLEPLVPAGEAGTGAGAGVSDASMPGTPQPAASGNMADDELIGPPPPPPAVILMGPPATQPFDMWSGQQAAEPVPGTSAAPSAAPGPPFSLKLCNSKGDAVMWGTSYDKEVDRDRNREFLLFFSDACVTPSAPDTAPPGPYAPELLDCPSEHPSLQEHRRRSAAGPQPVSLAACMTTFLQPERLAESDAWYCPRCKAHVCADKKLDLWSLPEVLVVHLKRFSYTRYSRNKLDTRVDFPLHGLDLGPYVMRRQTLSPLYDLFAVSNHYGSLGGGHYTAYAKLPSPPPRAPQQQPPQQAEGAGAPAEEGGQTGQAGEGERWYCFDDSHVSAVDPEVVRSPAAYVLFYRRRSEAAADPPVLGDMLERLREHRAAVQAEVEAEVEAEADGPARDAGSPAAGSDRRLEQDQGRAYGSGAGLGAVSIAAAAAAAKAARGKGRTGGGGGDQDEEEEDLEVTGRSSFPAFTAGRHDSCTAVGLRNRSGGGTGVGHVSSDLYGDAPSSPTPMSVGNNDLGGGGGAGCSTPPRHDDLGPSFMFDGGDGTAAAGEYVPGDYDAFALDDASGPGGGELIQPPGSPAEHNVNNADLSGLYDDVEAVRRRQSGSDMATSAGGNEPDDLDDDIMGSMGHLPLEGAREGGHAGAGAAAGGAGGGPVGDADLASLADRRAGAGLSLMSTSPM